MEMLRTIAVSRLYLDNFQHITAYWVGMGLKTAQVALSYGADDLHGTIVEEHIFHMAGAKTPQLQTERELVKAIRETGRTPVQRDTFYNPIRVWGETGGPIETELMSGGDASEERVRETQLAGP
jgi:aminodeoxyfutalosine synthase